MTRLVCRLLLATLLLPLTAILAVALVALVANSGPPTVVDGLVVWAAGYGFTAVYWLALWKGVVRWTSGRIAATLGAALAACIVATCGAVLIMMGPGAPLEAGVLFGGALAPPVWILLTILIWRESADERAERLKQAGVDTLSCLVCGYNLTGMSQARCPECGTTFTIEQLVAGQQADHVLGEE